MNYYLLIIPVLLILLQVKKILSFIGKKRLHEVINKGARIIDVRTPDEFRSHNVIKSINIQYQDILSGVKKHKITKETPIILYCQSGSRSSFAQKSLKNEGYIYVYNGGSATRLNRLLP